jgi:hypothetical protein
MNLNRWGFITSCTAPRCTAMMKSLKNVINKISERLKKDQIEEGGALEK